MEPGNIYPEYAAAIVRIGEDGERELVRARWGMPTPPKFIKGQHDPGVTNIRNAASPHWRRWLVMPATSFAEYGKERDPVTKKLRLYWFALGGMQPLIFFAGVWTRWHGKRKAKEDPAEHDIFAFLTTEANAVVAPTTRRRCLSFSRSFTRSRHGFQRHGKERKRFKGRWRPPASPSILNKGNGRRQSSIRHYGRGWLTSGGFHRRMQAVRA